MPNTPERGSQQPNADEQRRRQQLNDKALQDADGGDADENSEDENIEEPGRIEAPGTDEDEESGTLRTDSGGETGEDEDLPDDDDDLSDDDETQVSPNRGQR
jgi:hypothetical protein